MSRFVTVGGRRSPVWAPGCIGCRGAVFGKGRHCTVLTREGQPRSILLRRSSDNGVVQFGIVRLDLSYLSDDVISEILSEKIPLGRVLIQHDVMREVQRSELWQCRCGPDLQDYLGGQWPTVYGRTALIYCNGEPVVELLEIVTPS